MPTGLPTTNSTNKYPNVKQLSWAINYCSSQLLPYLHWALSNQHLYWPWEAVTIAKWKACVSGFANKTHIVLLASAIKYNITVYVRSSGCQYKHLGGGLFFWGPVQCISCILCPEPFYLFRVWLMSGGLESQSFGMEMPEACLSNTDKSDAKTFAL